MISKTIGFRGLAYFQTHPAGKIHQFCIFQAMFDQRLRAPDTGEPSALSGLAGSLAVGIGTSRCRKKKLTWRPGWVGFLQAISWQSLGFPRVSNFWKSDVSWCFCFLSHKSFHWADGRDIIDGFRRPEWIPATGGAPHGWRWINHLQAPPPGSYQSNRHWFHQGFHQLWGTFQPTLQGPSLDVWLHWRQRTWWIAVRKETCPRNPGHSPKTQHPQPPAAWAWTQDTTFPWKSSEMIDSLDGFKNNYHGHPWTILSQISSESSGTKKKSGIYYHLVMTHIAMERSTHF